MIKDICGVPQLTKMQQYYREYQYPEVATIVHGYFLEEMVKREIERNKALGYPYSGMWEPKTVKWPILIDEVDPAVKLSLGAYFSNARGYLDWPRNFGKGQIQDLMKLGHKEWSADDVEFQKEMAAYYDNFVRRQVLGS